MSRSQVFVSILAVPLLALLLACGGGDKKDSSSTNSNNGSSSSSTDGSSSSNSGSSSNNTTSNDGVASLENCKQYAQLEAAATSAFGNSSTGFKVNKDELDKLVKASPSEIRSDMQLVVNTIVDVFTGMEKLGVNFNDPSSFAKLDATKLQEMEKLTAKFDDKKFTDAAERIDKYFVSKCS